jgi:large conductance mechanosensitive channel
VVDLAIAVLIGAAFGKVIDALVKDIITPIIGIFGGIPSFADWSFAINGSTFMIGDFINVVLSFVILAAILYFFVVLPVEALMSRYKGEAVPEPVTTRECPHCLSKIPRAADRCAFCTSEVSPVATS